MMNSIRHAILLWSSCEDVFAYAVFLLSPLFCLVHIVIAHFNTSFDDKEQENVSARRSRETKDKLSASGLFTCLALWWCRDDRWPNCKPMTRVAFLLVSSVFLVQYAGELQDHVDNDSLQDIWPTRYMFPRSRDMLLSLGVLLPAAYLLTVTCLVFGIFFRSNVFMLASIPFQGILNVLLLYADACLHPLKQPHHRLYASIMATVGLGMTGPSDQSSSFVSKWTILILCATYFPGCVSKLLADPNGWLINGSVLCSHIEFSAATCEKSCPEAVLILREWVSKKWPVCALLSMTAIMFEGLSPLALLFPSSLPWFCLSMSLFHGGIKTLMQPNFAPQCLLVLLVLGTFDIEGKDKKRKEKGSWASRQQNQCRLQSGDGVRSMFATCLGLAVLVTTFLRLEVYPLSTISMYSISCNHATWRLSKSVGEPQVAFSSDTSLAHLVDLCAVRQAIICYPRMFFLKKLPAKANVGASSVQRLPVVLAGELHECFGRRGNCHRLLKMHSWDAQLPLCSLPLHMGSHADLMEHSSKQSVYAEQVDIARPRIETLIMDSVFAQLLWLNNSLPISPDSFAAARTGAWPLGGPAEKMLRPSVARWLQERLCGFCPLVQSRRESQTRMLQLRLSAYVQGKPELKIVSMSLPCNSAEVPKAQPLIASLDASREEM